MTKEFNSAFGKCSQCNKPILLSRHRTYCGECIEMNRNVNETEHSRLIRCPECQAQISMYDLEDILTDGDHLVTCPMCDHDFEITTRLEYYFESPALIK